MKLRLKLFMICLQFLITQSLQEIKSNTIHLSKNDMQKIKYDLLLKYNQQVDKLEYTTKGPIKVKVPSNFNFQEFTDKTDPSEKVPIQNVLAHHSQGRTLVYLFSNAFIKNGIMIVTLDSENSLTSKIFTIAPNSHRCENIKIIRERIYAGCIAESEQNVQLCNFNYKEETISECVSYKFDYNLKEGETLAQESLSMQYFQSPLGNDIFLFNFKNSLIEGLQSKFFLITPKGNVTVRVPVENLIINRVKIMKIDEMQNSFDMLMSRKNGKKYDILNFQLTNFEINRESLKQGLIREMIEWFDWGFGSLVLYENEVESKSIFKITLLDLEDLTQKRYILPGNHSILENQFSQGLIFLRLYKPGSGQHDFFINTISNRFCNFQIPYNLSTGKLSLISFDNSHDVFLFNNFDQLDQFEFSMTQFPLFNSVEFYFDHEAQDVNRWIEKDDLQQEYVWASISMIKDDETIYNLNIKFIEENYIERNFEGTTLKNRIEQPVIYSLDLKGNNLPSSVSDTSIFFLNEVPIDYQDFEDFMEEKSIFTEWMSSKLNLITTDWELITTNFRYIFSEQKVVSLKLSSKKIVMDQPIDVENIEFYATSYILSRFFLILIDGRSLFYLSDLDIQSKANEIQLKEVQLPLDRECHLVDNILSCFYPEDVDNPSKHLLLKFGVIDMELRTTEIISFIPDMSRLFKPFFFYFSFFNVSYFTTLSVNDQNKAVISFSNNSKDLYSYTLDFLDHNESEKVVFSPIYFNTQLIVYFKESLQVWVCYYDQFLYYPISEYTDGFKDYVGTFYRTGIPTFAVVYRTNWGDLQMILYQLSSQFHNRMVKKITLDKDDCPSDSVEVSFSQPRNYVYITYLCKQSKKIRVFKYSNHLEFSLILSKNTQMYTVSTGERYDQIFKVESTSYQNSISVDSSSAVFNETKDRVEVLDLENTEILKIAGDIYRAEVVGSNPRVELQNRLSQENLNTIRHNRELDFNYNLKFFALENESKVMVVSNEYIISGQDIQVNNFYTECIKPSTIILQSDKKSFENLYLCRNVDTLKFYLTDFRSIKLRLRLGNMSVNQPFIIISNNMLYLFYKFNSISHIGFQKFSLQKNNRGLLNQLSFGQVLNPYMSESFSGIQYFHISHSSTRNSLFIFRKYFHLNHISITEMNLKDESFKYSRIEYLELLSVSDSPLYFR